jgi:hypothetical protein
MSKGAVIRHEGREEEDEMAKRRRFAGILREHMDMPVTDEGLHVWQELKDEIDRARRTRS